MPARTWSSTCSSVTLSSSNMESGWSLAGNGKLTFSRRSNSLGWRRRSRIRYTDHLSFSTSRWSLSHLGSITGAACGSALLSLTKPRLSGWFRMAPMSRILFIWSLAQLIPPSFREMPLTARHSVGNLLYMSAPSTPVKTVLTSSARKRLPTFGLMRAVGTNSRSGPRSYPSSSAMALSIGDCVNATPLSPEVPCRSPSQGSLVKHTMEVIG
mmetsp:Transcript_102018/g.263727  ORF Transcript_102018/g.263727 Transcript_102018/m.263727 type:complete len:212 (+) Transcript_102018:559-1194(+)